MPPDDPIRPLMTPTEGDPPSGYAAPVSGFLAANAGKRFT